MRAHKDDEKCMQILSQNLPQNLPQNLAKNHPEIYPKILPEFPPYNPPKIHATLTRIESMNLAPNPCQIHAGIMPQIHARIDSNRVHDSW